MFRSQYRYQHWKLDRPPRVSARPKGPIKPPIDDICFMSSIKTLKQSRDILLTKKIERASQISIARMDQQFGPDFFLFNAVNPQIPQSAALQNPTNFATMQ